MNSVIGWLWIEMKSGGENSRRDQTFASQDFNIVIPGTVGAKVLSEA